MNVITKSVQLPDGRTITIETGKVAKQADGAAVLRMGNTVLLATVCAAKDAVPGTDFMPLQVDYREQYSAAGRFPGGFTKREGRAGEVQEVMKGGGKCHADDGGGAAGANHHRCR